MPNWLSPPTRAALARLPEADREVILKQVKKRTKSTDVFEALTMFGGLVGLNWLYLRKIGPFITRLCHLLAALVVIGTGLAVTHDAIIYGGLAYLAIVLILWLYDWATVARTVDDYHDRLDALLQLRLPPAPVAEDSWVS